MPTSTEQKTQLIKRLEDIDQELVTLADNAGGLHDQNMLETASRNVGIAICKLQKAIDTQEVEMLPLEGRGDNQLTMEEIEALDASAEYKAGYLVGNHSLGAAETNPHIFMSTNWMEWNTGWGEGSIDRNDDI